MTKKHKTTNSHSKPPFIVIGLLLYFILYVIAACFYPGGSNFNSYENGFHVLTNYWCELLSEYSKNGQINKARPFGLVAMLILAGTLSYFWLKISQLLPLKKWQHLTLRWSGVFSMIFSLLIFTDFHDVVIGIAVVLGSISFILTIYGLLLNGFSGFVVVGTINLVLIILNMIIYLTNQWIAYLPIIQKLTFVLIFIWIGSISLQFDKMKKHNHETL